MQTVGINVADIGRRIHSVEQSNAPRKWKRIELFLKVAEVCNIECTYCYFFFGGDESFESHPAYISQKTIKDVAEFLARTARMSGVEEVQIDFHGGEPLMLKKQRFDEMCKTLKEHLDFVDLTLSVQTNAMLIDDDWVALLGKHDVSIGVSLDGPRDYNDEYRIDHKKRGTYDRTLAGIRKLQEGHRDGRMRKSFGIICVADSSRSAKATLDHFVDDLGIKDIVFAMPMVSHETMDAESVQAFSKYMCDLTDAWTNRNDPAVKIGFIDQMLALLIRGRKELESADEMRGDRTLFTISSSGELGGQDDERVASYAFGTGVHATGEIGLSDFYATPPLRKYLTARQELGRECKSCCWMNVCRGGEAISGNLQRYSATKGFANVSVYCSAIQAVLVKLTDYAIAKGVPFETISEVLIDDEHISESV